jgi:hypothetical protein
MGAPPVATTAGVVAASLLAEAAGAEAGVLPGRSADGTALGVSVATAMVAAGFGPAAPGPLGRAGAIPTTPSLAASGLAGAAGAAAASAGWLAGSGGSAAVGSETGRAGFCHWASQSGVAVPVHPPSAAARANIANPFPMQFTSS